MTKQEKLNLSTIYSQYYSAYKNQIISAEKFDGIKAITETLLTSSEIIAIQNKINWEDHKRIYLEFTFLEEIINPKMNYLFKYNINSLDYIKDEFQFHAESDKQYKAICSRIDELINRITAI